MWMEHYSFKSKSFFPWKNPFQPYLCFLDTSYQLYIQKIIGYSWYHPCWQKPVFISSNTSRYNFKFLQFLQFPIFLKIMKSMIFSSLFKVVKILLILFHASLIFLGYLALVKALVSLIASTISLLFLLVF